MNGILLVDKSAGWTSNDVVAKLKGVLHTRRVGHSGTLDPMATGLLVVFVGRATRAAEFAEGHDKRYIAGFRPGVVTDTQDVTGTVLRSIDAEPTDAELRAVLTGFVGKIKQIPPMYSAIKVNGQRLYAIARKGGEVERAPREIEIYSIESAGRDGRDFILDISCSKGTYVRTLCSDLGETLGCGGCMSSLRRVGAGRFCIEHAHTMDEIRAAADKGCAEELLLPLDCMFGAYPSLTVGESEERRLRCGNAIAIGADAGEYRVYSPAGEFLLLGRVEGGILRTVKNFFEV